MCITVMTKVLHTIVFSSWDPMRLGGEAESDSHWRLRPQVLEGKEMVLRQWLHSDCKDEEDSSNTGWFSPVNATGAKKKTKKQQTNKKTKEKGSESESAQIQPVKMNSLPAEDQETQATELFSLPKQRKRLASEAAGPQTGRSGTQPGSECRAWQRQHLPRALRPAQGSPWGAVAWGPWCGTRITRPPG